MRGLVRKRTVLWAAFLIGLATFGAGLPTYLRTVGTDVKLEHARRRWDARPFLSYRLEVTQRKLESAGGYHPFVCHEDHTVSGARVRVVHRDTCQRVSDPPTTVAVLFDQIGYWNGRCGPNGCACDGRYRVHAVYDRQLGYPQHIRTQLPEEGWEYRLGSVLRALTRTTCTAKGAVNIDLRARLKPILRQVGQLGDVAYLVHEEARGWSAGR